MRIPFTLLFLCFAPLAHATPIVLDVGARGNYYVRSYALPYAAPLQGQTVPIDLAFSDSVTAVRGSDVPGFLLAVVFATDAKNVMVGVADATGYLLDATGNPMSDPVWVYGAAYYGQDEAGFYLGFSPSISSPLTFYGAHFDITFPDSPYSVIGGTVEFIGDRPFRIGPVPDGGSTALLFCFPLAALGISKCFPKRRLKW